MHNDLKLDNCQFDPADPDRVQSIFDWDMTTLGEPLVDLGTLLNYWPDPSDPPNAGRVSHEGLHRPWACRRAAEITDRYAERTGLDVSAAGWYEAFAQWKTGVVIQQLHNRWLRGESTDPRMATIADRLPTAGRNGLATCSTTSTDGSAARTETCSAGRRRSGPGDADRRAGRVTSSWWCSLSSRDASSGARPSVRPARSTSAASRRRWARPSSSGEPTGLDETVGVEREACRRRPARSARSVRGSVRNPSSGSPSSGTNSARSPATSSAGT